MRMIYEVAAIGDRVRRDGFLKVLNRLIVIVWERISPPWHCLYWYPISQPEDHVGQQATPLQRVLSRLTEHVEVRVIKDPSEFSTVCRQLLERSLGSSGVVLYAERLAKGSELHLLFLGDRVVGGIFFVLGRVQGFQHVVLTDRDAMGLDGWIAPDFRGRGLFPVLLSSCIVCLRKKGIQRLYIDCSERNEESMRSFTCLGFRYLLRFRTKCGRYLFDRKAL